MSCNDDCMPLTNLLAFSRSENLSQYPDALPRPAIDHLARAISKFPWPDEHAQLHFGQLQRRVASSVLDWLEVTMARDCRLLCSALVNPKVTLECNAKPVPGEPYEILASGTDESGQVFFGHVVKLMLPWREVRAYSDLLTGGFASRVIGLHVVLAQRTLGEIIRTQN